mmetsp:Transcript_3941/g.7956  ORF Transcript_3941/g.7956 Transcript_3941/m.7956 type:complete len:94 (+) Transcript_3941:272-553(+)
MVPWLGSPIAWSMLRNSEHWSGDVKRSISVRIKEGSLRIMKAPGTNEILVTALESSKDILRILKTVGMYVHVMSMKQTNSMPLPATIRQRNVR